MNKEWVDEAIENLEDSMRYATGKDYAILESIVSLLKALIYEE